MNSELTEPLDTFKTPGWKFGEKGRTCSTQARSGGVNSDIENALWNDADPRILYKREKPIHRHIAELHWAKHLSIIDIAALLDMSVNTVSNVLRQPWARQYMIDAMKKDALVEMREFLEGELMPSLKKLAVIRDDAKAPVSEQRGATNDLLNRFLGKPVQPITNNDKPAADLSPDELERAVKEALAGVRPPSVDSDEPNGVESTERL